MNDKQCEMCINYIYDEDEERMVCAVDMDEDEAAAYVDRRRRGCPYFRRGDEYTIVNKQI